MIAQQPTPPPVAAPPAAVSTDAQWRLLGIVFGAQPEAILEEAQTKKLYFVHAGDAVLGWRVQSITEEQITLHGDQGDVTLALD